MSFDIVLLPFLLLQYAKRLHFKYACTYLATKTIFLSILINYDKLFWLRFMKKKRCATVSMLLNSVAAVNGFHGKQLRYNDKRHHNVIARRHIDLPSLHSDMSTCNTKNYCSIRWNLLILSRTLIRELCYFNRLFHLPFLRLSLIRVTIIHFVSVVLNALFMSFVKIRFLRLYPDALLSFDRHILAPNH